MRFRQRRRDARLDQPQEQSGRDAAEQQQHRQELELEFAKLLPLREVDAAEKEAGQESHQ